MPSGPLTGALLVGRSEELNQVRPRQATRRSAALARPPIGESREAFLAAAPGIFAIVGDDQFDEWEAEPIASLHRVEA